MALKSQLLLIVVATCWALSSCSDDVGVERTEAQCSDQKDNDGDGAIDCLDPDCRPLQICGAPQPDAGDDLLSPDGGTDAVTDSTKTDALAVIPEVEPNDGKTVDQLQEIDLPSLVAGAIGSANDADIFALNVIAGDRLRVEVTPTGELRPHVAVFSGAGVDIPPAVNASDSGSVLVEYYALAGGQLLVGIRDRRNVGDTPAGVGGPTLGYTLSVTRLARDPIPIVVGETKVESLAPSGTVRVFSFDAQKDDALTLQVLTESLSQPSTADARLSLFHPASQSRLGTNEALDSGDALLEGSMPLAGTYHAIVENVALDADDLRFSFSLAVQSQ